MTDFDFGSPFVPPTYQQHLARYLRQHRPHGVGCACGSPGSWPEHVASVAATILHNTAVTATEPKRSPPPG